MIRSPRPRITFLLASLLLLIVGPMLHAQRADSDATDSADADPLAGYDRIGIHGGGSAVLHSFNDEAIPKIRESSYPAASPSGLGFTAGVVYARLLPNLFVTKPATPEEEADPERLYRKLTTFELRLLYSRMEGSSTAHDYYPIRGNSTSIYVEQTIRSRVDIIVLEPQLFFDLRPMREPFSGFLSLGGSFGHISEASFDFTVRPTEPTGEPVPLPSSGDEPYDARSFYAALMLGGGMRIGLGGDIRTAPALVPSASVLVPLTSIGEQSRWLPFGLRFGMSLYWPI